MELPSMDMLLFLLAAGFIAAFIDSVVGGGGLISVPALMMTGMPPALVLGTNKLGSTFSTITSSLSFFTSGKMNGKLVLALFPLSFIGAVLGAYTVHLLPSDFLKPLVVIMLVLMLVYTLIKKNWGKDAAPRTMTINLKVAVAALAFIIGFYDGFFGPGTGSFLLFMFLLLGFDFVGASANAKVLNLASNLASLCSFLLLKSVHIGYGLPMGIAMIAGAFVGSKFAIRHGSRYIKPLFVTVTTILIGKQLWDLLQ
ncbi:sulfite exporter TauE/SafE family protein [Paenibacillus radicis (ex Xue et al. 2023)]|uniref:Probable membrane transporter protein n=1 Tax=Paenibacillus radicis (ex Xue et al. 2023) TaxID=2972489 RepID=A0ABT1YQ16_9BACL|nr:TSUP family transporter [Paenibacillus radicis (ex Xue et al. 2023)]MCR8635276.1 TSUP family transporter [Paenibacillus radicis (ex Xue et al. 2023)]